MGRAAQPLPHPREQVGGEAFTGAVDDGQQDDVAAGEDEPSDALGEDDLGGRLRHLQVGRAGRHQHALVKLGTEFSEHRLQHGEVDHRALGAHLAVEAQGHAVVVAVEAFAAAIVDGEMSCAETDVGAGEFEAGLHACVP